MPTSDTTTYCYQTLSRLFERASSRWGRGGEGSSNWCISRLVKDQRKAVFLVYLPSVSMDDAKNWTYLEILDSLGVKIQYRTNGSIPFKFPLANISIAEICLSWLDCTVNTHIFDRNAQCRELEILNIQVDLLASIAREERSQEGLGIGDL